MKKAKLLYLPYAGGSAQICKAWKQFVDKEIEVQPIELPGRGSRFRKNFYENMDEALEDLYQSIKRYEEEPYALYGHSFGALLVYELYYKILDKGEHLPAYLFFSGSLPPDRRVTVKTINDLPDKEFINEINQFNGMDQAILQNEELMELFLPVLRADFRLLEEYRYERKPEKIKSPVSVLYGNDMTMEGIKGWGELIDTDITYHHINGDHFFIRKNTEEVMNVVNRQMKNLREFNHDRKEMRAALNAPYNG